MWNAFFVEAHCSALGHCMPTPLNTSLGGVLPSALGKSAYSSSLCYFLDMPDAKKIGLCCISIISLENSTHESLAL